MANILIFDSDRNICASLYENLALCNQVVICDQPSMLLNHLMEYRPQLLIVDLSMVGEDGIGLIKLAYLAGVRPRILASSRFYSEYVTNQMMQFHTDFMFVRPISAEQILPRVVDILLGLGNEDPVNERRLTNEILLRLSFTMNRGYYYVVESIVYICKHMDCALTNELYPDVAKILGGNGKQVEHIIRTNIKQAWSRGNPEVWKLYFPLNKYGQIDCMTNGEFLRRIAYAINDYREQYEATRTG